MSGIILPFKELRLRAGAFIVLFLSVLTSAAQTENVGIGTTKPDNSALLDLTSNSRGLLIPRMTLAQRAGIKNPATGLIVYQLDFFTGFYFFDGVNWKGLYARSNDGAALAGENFSSNNNNSGNGWNIDGNTGLNSESNFIGTLDTTSLVFKVNNYRSGLIDYRFGNTYFGYRAGYRSQGLNSIAIGAYALYDTNYGLNNIAIGYQSLLSNKTGSDNIALGANSLINNTTGSQNISIGTQAGQRSTGDGNIFIGHNAGINEIGSNRLYIENGFRNIPLIYGDFENARVGINTKQPESALSIDSKVANISGLEFKQLTSNSSAVHSNLKVLSLNDKGQVILVRDSVGVTPPVIPNYWTLKGSAIDNNNAGDVIVSNLRFKSLRTISPAIKSNGKVLTVDDDGLIVLAKDSTGNNSTNYWKLSGNNISNSNTGKLIVNGSLQFNDIKAANKAFRPYGKVLTVDDSGNLILVRDSVASSIPTSPWNINGNNIANSNLGAVFINNELILSKFSINNSTSVTAQKFLTVDNAGNVIMANSPSPPVSGPSQWSTDGSNIGNNNSGGVYINNGLWTKNGLRLQSGILELSGSVDNKSGIQFSQLKAASTAGRAYGKVLSVDDFGNVILVKDSVGVSTTTSISSPWTISGNDIVNSNIGKVYINNGLSSKGGLTVESGNLVTNGSVTNRSGLVLNQLKLSFPASRPSGKVLSVDENGNVILVRDSVTTGSITGVSSWNISGNNIANNNSGTVFINSNLTLSRLSSNNTPTVTSQKVLSVDANGNVILVNTPSITPSGIELWRVNTKGEVTNTNTGGIFITSSQDGKSGLQLLNLRAASAAGNSYGKVLSVDDFGNVILVNDAVGSGGGGSSSNGWTIVDGRLHNSNNGKVVIGTGISSFPDGYQLFVKGGILTERVRVAVANSDRWADYVFKKGYRLRSLHEVEKFINHYHHLPNVPSAKEMAKDGLDVMETSAKLMEKIEELTLYLIKANKQIEALERKVDNLEKTQK
ncbi:hypothetical protein EMA8858_00112 [Emticicia aquatica]|uniref:Peptidase S74 domain-containing protein n=1 Tax=Emticicia aquatica TaxID=1681835 RepID=A0ABN8EN67_9BACT|nr:hypothetical protein [Emticicia aquatica]CAH0994005.1 hypothetical protein EMA8858_00112 [Emticicia aquatica]